MKLIAAFIFFFFALSLKAQKINLKNHADTVNILIQNIKSENIVTSFFAGPGPSTSKQYFRFVYLLTVADNNELINIVKTQNGCARVYAYIGLYHNKYNHIEDINKILQNDTIKIGTMSGCIPRQLSVADIIKNVTDWYSERQTNDLLTFAEKHSDFKSDMFEDIINNND